MRIAQVAPLYEAVPPHRYGGTERVVAALTDGLVDRGHDVTLFAAGESVTRAKPARGRARTAAHPHDPSGAARGGAAHPPADARRSVSRPRLRRHPFASRRLDDAVRGDVGDSHRDDVARTARPADGAGRARHVSAGPDRVDQRRSAAAAGRPRPRLGGDGAARTRARRLPRPSTPDGGHLAFVGRVCSEKGLDTAITVARRCGRPLHIAAKVDPMDVEYFECVIEPLLGDDTVFVGEIGEDRKPGFYASPRRRCSRSPGPSRSASS